MEILNQWQHVLSFTQMCIDNLGKITRPNSSNTCDDNGAKPLLFCQNNNPTYFTVRNLNDSFECNSNDIADTCKLTQCTITSDYSNSTETFMNIVFKGGIVVKVVIFIMIILLVLLKYFV